jgi:hypothetical protein
VPEADPAVRRPFFRRYRAVVAVSLALGEQRKIEYERQLESRDELSILSPGLFREFRRAGIVVYVEQHQSRRRPHPQRVPALGRRQERTPRQSRAWGISSSSPTATASSCSRKGAGTKACRARRNTG